MGHYDIPPLTVGCPLYRAIKVNLLKALAAGDWRYGELIPSEKKLAQRFGVSIGTLRKAVDELVKEHILTRHQGLGTFVGRRHQRDYKTVFFRFISPTNNPTLKTRPQPLRIALDSYATGMANPLEQNTLRLKQETPVIRLELSHCIDTSLAAYERITLPRGLFCSLTEAIVRHHADNLYQLFEDAFNVSVLKVQDTVTCQPMSPTLASAFKTSSNSAVLVQHRVAWSHHDFPVEYRTTWINPQWLNIGIDTLE